MIHPNRDFSNHHHNSLLDHVELNVAAQWPQCTSQAYTASLVDRGPLISEPSSTAVYQICLDIPAAACVWMRSHLIERRSPRTTKTEIDSNKAREKQASFFLLFVSPLQPPQAPSAPLLTSILPLCCSSPCFLVFTRVSVSGLRGLSSTPLSFFTCWGFIGLHLPLSECLNQKLLCLLVFARVCCTSSPSTVLIFRRRINFDSPQIFHLDNHLTAQERAHFTFRHHPMATAGAIHDESWTVKADELVDFFKRRDEGDGQSLKELRNKYNGPEGLAQLLKSDAKHGLSAEEVPSAYAARKEIYGINIIPEKSPRTYFDFLFDALSDRTLIILIVAAVLSIGLETGFPPPGASRAIAWIEGVAILIAVALVSNVTAANDTIKDRRFRQLTAISEDRKVRCIRGGQWSVISVNDLLVGDIVSVETGDRVPADIVLFEYQGLRSDESSMTGESDTVKKNKENPWLLSGCSISEGTGKGVVICVGPQSQWGLIKASLDQEERKTPLQEHLNDLAENIGKAGLAAATITLIGLFIRWAVLTFPPGQPHVWNSYYLGEWIRFVIIAIVIIVVAVPEGLPLAVTLSLAYSMFKMMKDQNLVRHLAACETMGGATQICSDKTDELTGAGTLTQNRMTVVRLWAAGVKLEDQPKDKSAFTPKILELLNDGVCINSSAAIQNKDTEKPEFVGLKTECALLMMASNLGTDYETVRSRGNVARAWPFSSKLKRMSTAVRTEDKIRLYTKGASEVILDLCTHQFNADGSVKSMSEENREMLNNLINTWASQGLRTLTLAARELPKETEFSDEGECPYESNLTLIGIVGIQDPLRPEVPNSIMMCQRAGITVRMLTGDNILTAKQIGKSCGILTEEGIAMEGPDFRKLSVEKMDRIIPRLQIIARCSPEDKLTLVKRLIELGEVVAVTGDGTNDVPALCEADVGFAMGISGTEVAKDACDIILLDDNFSSIERAVMWGRGVYDAIRKYVTRNFTGISLTSPRFIQFQLTVNIVAVTVAFVGAVSGGDSPLQPVQMLWVNLIMDTMAALALATEKPTMELFNRPPHGRHSPLITWRMWRHIAGHAIVQLGVMGWLYYGGSQVSFFEYNEPHESEIGTRFADQAAYEVEERNYETRRSTVIFNTFVFMQLFNELNARKLEDELNMLKDIKSSYLFIGIFFITAIVQAIIVEFGGEFSKTTHLNAKTWAVCLALGFLSIPVGILLRFIPVPADKERTSAPPEYVADEAELTLMEDVRKEEAARSRRPSKSSRAHEPSDTLVDNYFPPSSPRRTPKGNWAYAKRILWQVQVVAAFRKPSPKLISGRGAAHACLVQARVQALSIPGRPPTLLYRYLARCDSSD
ncbi:P-type ATPase [Planoprotostelium fungivorum]|uniref:Calcium-transporting ATPase n=1 Tax=Planoprotostelium fungivorum TaxID=1890364 RepID=A0A2P6NQJ0_9EUKA|nr:P-type ATPase [Planoprotostelium fungivorum]